MLYVDSEQLIKDVHRRPMKSISKHISSFLRSKICRQLKKYFKIKRIRLAYCRQKSKDEMAFYIMGTQHSPVIFFCDDVLKSEFPKWSSVIGKKGEKALIFHTFIHELTHAFLDWKGLGNRQSEHLINDFAFATMRSGLKSSKIILIKYLKRRGK